MSKEHKEEYIKTQEYRDWLVSLLSYGKPVTITFTKKDGTKRIMKCTRNMSNIPEQQHPKNETTDSGTSVRAFDLEKKEWRSFIAENVTRIEHEF
jgi:hypothetical protein